MGIYLDKKWCGCVYETFIFDKAYRTTYQRSSCPLHRLTSFVRATWQRSPSSTQTQACPRVSF